MVCVPTRALLGWIFFRGCPFPKGSSCEQLIAQVKLAFEIGQPFDYDRIQFDDRKNAKLYVSWDKLHVESEVMWTEDQALVIEFLRSDGCPKISLPQIDKVFGKSKNGVRNRAW